MGRRGREGGKGGRERGEGRRKREERRRKIKNHILFITKFSYCGYSITSHYIIVDNTVHASKYEYRSRDITDYKR